MDGNSGGGGEVLVDPAQPSAVGSQRPQRAPFDRKDVLEMPGQDKRDAEVRLGSVQTTRHCPPQPLSPPPTPSISSLHSPSSCLGSVAGLREAGGHHITEPLPCLLGAQGLTGSWNQVKWRGNTTTQGDGRG